MEAPKQFKQICDGGEFQPLLCLFYLSHEHNSGLANIQRPGDTLPSKQVDIAALTSFLKCKDVLGMTSLSWVLGITTAASWLPSRAQFALSLSPRKQQYLLCGDEVNVCSGTSGALCCIKVSELAVPRRLHFAP